MNFKRNAFGLLAAGALSLGMASGVMAAVQEEVEITATLSDGTMCTISSLEVEGDGFFGDYMWNDEDNHFYKEGGGEVTISGASQNKGLYDESDREGACGVAMNAEQLHTEDGGQIDLKYHGIGSGAATGVPIDEWRSVDVTNNEFSVTITLAENIGNPGALGEYSSTVTFSADMELVD